MGTFFALLGGKLLGLVLPALATALSGLLVGVLTRQLKKLGFELTEKQAEKLKAIVADAVRAVEEQARRTKMTSDSKREHALALIRAQVPHLDELAMRTMLDAVLPVVRSDLSGMPSKGPLTTSRSAH